MFAEISKHIFNYADKKESNKETVKNLVVNNFNVGCSYIFKVI